MHRIAFGTSPAAVDVRAMEAIVAYHLASLAGDGLMLDFGDSHATAG